MGRKCKQMLIGGAPFQTWQELKAIIAADDARFNGKIPGLKDYILHNERWYIYRFKHELRYVEYYMNVRKMGIRGLLFKLLYLIHWYRYKRLSWKLHWTIYPNVLGAGFHIYHVGGFVYIGPENKFGRNCTFLPGTVFVYLNDGRKREIGDNCSFGLNSKITNALNIGNNVVVGANAVVTKDIPDNAVVAGVPARVIKFKQIGG